MGSAVRRAGYQRAGGLENRPRHTDKGCANPPPAPGISVLPPSEAAVEGSEMGSGFRRRDTPVPPGKGHKGMRHQRIDSGWVPAPESCVPQRRVGKRGDPSHPCPLQRHRPGKGPAIPKPGGGGNSQDGFGTLKLSGSMRRRPWGGQGFPGSPAVRRAGGMPEPAGFPAVPSWQGAAPVPRHR